MGADDAQCSTQLSALATCNTSGVCERVITPDAGMPDAGMVDSGMPDAGMVDSGMPDAGMMDSGMPDASVPDAGPDSGSTVAITL
ncbi:MAG: hypothetical protein RL385_1759 [Pseudomonadota bacterium]|jgi:hypothetical protein